MNYVLTVINHSCRALVLSCIHISVMRLEIPALQETHLDVHHLMLPGKLFCIHFVTDHESL